MPSPCKLGSRHDGYGNCNEFEGETGEVRLYARIESGALVELLTLSPRCPAETRDRITDLGLVDATRSFEWLRRRVPADTAVREDLLAAIAMHRGAAPLEYLVAAANGSAEGDSREGAIFWLGQVRIEEAAPAIERLMFADDSADIRQHAAFVLAQSKFARRSEALIRQGRGDANSEVRSQAWFWLAQTAASESEQAIRRAMVEDPDPEVREEAVFALSQLPGERAVDALLRVLEDQRLDRELRKSALFWLAQSDSDRAFASLERLLVESAPR
jgi:HEAT repeat protein